MAVVEEAAVAIDLRIGAFAKHLGDPAAIEAGVQLGTARALHAVRGPHDLWQATELGELADLLAGVIDREALVAGRMPVLRRDDRIEDALEAGGDRDRLVTARYGERASGTEVVLEIDEDEGAHVAIVVR